MSKLENSKCKNRATISEAALFERLKAHRWSAGFDGDYAECFCVLIAIANRSRTLREVIENLPHYQSKFALVDLLSAMSNLGFSVQQRIDGPDNIKEDELPCLFIPPDKKGQKAKPIVVISLDRAGGKKFAKIYSSKASRTKNVEFSALPREHRGRIYLFKRNEDQRAENLEIVRKSAGYGWFRALLMRFYKNFSQIFFLSFAINVLGLAAPLYVMFAYERVFAAQMIEVLPYLAVGVGICVIGEWKLRRERSARLAWMAARIDNIVGNLTFTKLLGLPVSATAKASVSDQILRLRSFESLRDFFSGAAALSVIELPFVLIYLGVIMMLGGYLVVAPVAGILLYGAIYFVMKKKIGVEMRRTSKAGAIGQRFLLETFAKNTDIQSLGLTKRWNRKYQDISNREFAAFRKFHFAGSTAEILAQSVTTLGGLATIAFGAALVVAGSLSPGALIACLILAWKTMAPFHNLCAVIQRIEQLQNSVNQIDLLMDIEAKNTSEKSGAYLPSITGSVEFQNVGLRIFDNKTPIFINARFKASQGEIIGISGQSGAGKTLILQMILGMYQSTYGTIKVDGFNISQLNCDALRKLISYVPQQPRVIFGSIEENIRFVKPDASTDEIWHVLDQVGARDSIEQLTEGLKTRVEIERRISPTLLTQISHARALLLNSSLFLIDDIPSSLLYGRERPALFSYIRRNRGAKTFIIATQNHDLLKICDQVFELTPIGMRKAPTVGAPGAVAKAEAAA